MTIHFLFGSSSGQFVFSVLILMPTWITSSIIYKYKFRSSEMRWIPFIPTMFQASNADCHRVFFLVFLHIRCYSEVMSPYALNIWSDGNSSIIWDELPTRCVFSKNVGQRKKIKHLKATTTNSFELVCRRNGKITANDKFELL